jgi:hypothetical protein
MNMDDMELTHDNQGQLKKVRKTSTTQLLVAASDSAIIDQHKGGDVGHSLNSMSYEGEEVEVTITKLGVKRRPPTNAANDEDNDSQYTTTKVSRPDNKRAVIRIKGSLQKTMNRGYELLKRITFESGSGLSGSSNNSQNIDTDSDDESDDEMISDAQYDAAFNTILKYMTQTDDVTMSMNGMNSMNGMSMNSMNGLNMNGRRRRSNLGIPQPHFSSYCYDSYYFKTDAMHNKPKEDEQKNLVGEPLIDDGSAKFHAFMDKMFEEYYEKRARPYRKLKEDGKSVVISRVQAVVGQGCGNTHFDNLGMMKK